MARKMILVDPRVLESTRPFHPPDTIADNIRTLDNEMENILERQDLDVRSKAKLYQQILHRYLHRIEQYKNKPLGSVELVKPQPPVLNTTPVLETQPVIKDADTSTVSHLPVRKRATPKPDTVKKQTTLSYKTRKPKAPDWQSWPNE